MEYFNLEDDSELPEWFTSNIYPDQDEYTKWEDTYRFINSFPIKED